MTGIVQTLIGGFGAVAAAVTDAYFNLVTLLLPGNGTNGAQNNTFLDSSTNNFTITRNGNTTQGTFSPFSQTGWSNYFGGGTNYLTVPDSTDLQFGTGDFTISAWIYLNSTSSEQSICAKGTNTTGWAFNINSSGKLMWLDTTAANIAATTLTTNVWHYVVASRVGTTFRLFLNGTQDLSITISTNYNQTNTFNIALSRDGSWPLNGYLSNLKVVKGSGVSSVTVPSSPETSTTGTSLLTCQSNRFVDTNTQVAAKTITVNGTPSVQAFSPFAPTAAYSAATNGGSGYFDGNGDYLNVASNAAFDIEGGAYTIEGWFYFNSIATGQRFFVFDGTSQTRGVIVGGSSTNNLEVNHFGVGTVITATNALVGIVGSWAHVCIASNGTNRSIFVNGTRYATSTSALFQNTNNAVGIAGIGGTYSGSNPNAYISGFRVVKGTAVYDPTLTTLTLPTAPPTAITNTSLLANFTNGGIIDATGKNDLETVGNAQISTTQSKFGGSSMYFDGTNDAVVVSNSSASPNLEFQGDFTVECWFYLAGGAGTRRDIVHYDDGSNGLGIFVNTTNVLWAGVVSYSASSFTPSLNTWYHVALVRSGTATNNCKLYVDGTQVLQFTNTTTVNPSANMYIGAVNNLDGDFNGYIDDLRITKGYARYTANFTAPTAAFPVQ